MNHSLSCDTPGGHSGPCRPRIHLCTVPCSYDIVDAEGDYRGNVATRQIAGEILARALEAGAGYWEVEERCECRDER